MLRLHAVGIVHRKSKILSKFLSLCRFHTSLECKERARVKLANKILYDASAWGRKFTKRSLAHGQASFTQYVAPGRDPLFVILFDSHALSLQCSKLTTCNSIEGHANSKSSSFAAKVHTQLQLPDGFRASPSCA